MSAPLKTGDRVVIEPKRPSAPRYAWSSPYGVVIHADPSKPEGPVRIRFAYDVERDVPRDLITRYETWAKRSQEQLGPKAMPRLGRLHQIDPGLGVAEPPLFEDFDA